VPNHCSNSLTVIGPDAPNFFAQVAATIDPDGTLGNFIETFIPMPEPMRNIHTGGATIDGEYVSRWHEAEDGTKTIVTDVEVAAMVDCYGADNWYDWCVHNWGTKWGAYDVDQLTDERLTFDTAWSPPVPAIQHISRLFPRSEFILAFAEGGSAFYGKATFRNGSPLPEPDTFESSEFWKPTEDDGDEDNDDPFSGTTDECAAHLEEYDLHRGG
jgi:Ferredoxin-like domain in Api92-like protein